MRASSRAALWLDDDAKLTTASLARALDARVPARPDTDGMKAVEAVSRIRKLVGTGGADAFILSMARGCDDMLATLVLARIAGLYRPDDGVADISVVPLFETLDDLSRCGAEVEAAVTHP